MIIDFYTLFLILILHFIGDFILQSDKQSKLKSTDNKQLACHVLTYTITFFSFMWLVSRSFKFAFIFSVITFVLHFITDYFTSKVVKKLYDKDEIHDMFVVIGLDQLIHYITLIITWAFVLKNLKYF